MTSVPRGPVGAAAAAPPAPPPGAGVSLPPAAPRPPAAPPAGVAGFRFRIRCVDDGEKANDWMSCQDLIVPVARLRSSTRVGEAGGVAAPRPLCVPGAGVPGAV